MDAVRGADSATQGGVNMAADWQVAVAASQSVTRLGKIK